MNVATVFAHQDDEMACLGTLLRLKRERRVSIALIVTTNGDKGAPWAPERPRADVAAERDREMRAVAAALDAEYVCLDEPDQFLLDGPDVRLALIEALRAVRPDVVFTHFTQEYNEDHVVTARLTCHAALMTQIASVRTASRALERVPAIFHTDPGDGYGYEGTHFVVLSREIADEKARIIRLHASQMAAMRELSGRDYADLVLEADRRRGARLGQPYAEVFRPCLMERRIPTAALLP